MLSFVFSSNSEDLVSTWDLEYCDRICYTMFTHFYFQRLFTILADSFCSLCILFGFGLFLDRKTVEWEKDLELKLKQDVILVYSVLVRFFF